MSETATIEPTPRSKVRRRAGRASYDRTVIDAILDEGLVAHVGICDGDGQPFVLPVVYARDGDTLYLHGSAVSRLLGTLGSGARMCLTVTLVDGVVLARSAFHHSLNYRSVVALGEGRLVVGEDEQRAALLTIVEHVAAGRSSEIRGPHAKELKATAVVSLALREVSAKIRTGPPIDDAADYQMDVWAGVVPLRLQAGDPIPDPRCQAEPPRYARSYKRDALSRVA